MILASISLCQQIKNATNNIAKEIGLYMDMTL